MRFHPATLIILVVAGCAVAPERAKAPVDSDRKGRFHSGPPEDDRLNCDEKWVGEATPEFAPDPSEPITVDFVGRKPMPMDRNPIPGLEPMPFGRGMFGPWDTDGGADAVVIDGLGEPVRRNLHTYLHYIALRSGLQIIVEGEVSETLITYGRLPKGDLTREEALKLIQSVCKANKLDYIEEGDIVIVKKRPVELALAHVVASELAGHYDVNFEDHELVAAIMEVATVTKTQVFVPAIQVSPDDPLGEDEERAELPIDSVKISLFMRAATPDSILRKLAELGSLDVEVIAPEDGSGNCYKFKYRE